MKVYRDIYRDEVVNGVTTKVYDHTEEIFNIMKGTYSGTYMGDRSITVHIDFPAPVDLKIGDYIQFETNTLARGIDNNNEVSYLERFYLYNEQSTKKISRPLTKGDAFQSDVVFKPRQYELVCTKFRDLYENQATGLVYTGNKQVNFYGGAKQVMDRLMAVLHDRYGHTGVAGIDYWDYMIADDVNEERNTACEKFQFDISDSSIMDVLNKLSDEEGINTHYWINERMIYVGFRNPYITGVNSQNQAQSFPFDFAYGKTSHLPIETNHGNLFTIQKSVDDSSPITRLYADGSTKNLHRFYCSDRIKSGRYVERLMLPSFNNDGHTDYVEASQEFIDKYGIREGFKTFDDIYPSLRHFTYGDLRKVRYCIKLMGSGLEDDGETLPPKTVIYVNDLTQDMLDDIDTRGQFIKDSKTYNLNETEAKCLKDEGFITKFDYSIETTYEYPVARIQCYRVDPIITNGVNTGLNKLTQCPPPVDLAIFVHATGKVVKCILKGGVDNATAIAAQLAQDGKVPADKYGTAIPGSCFAVDCGVYTPTTYTPQKYVGPIGSKEKNDSGSLLTRADWFVNPDTIPITDDPSIVSTNENRVIYKNEVSINQINYTDTAWITDIFEFDETLGEQQKYFPREGYSAYCWPRVNSYYPSSNDNRTLINKIVDVTPVVTVDTDLSLAEKNNQATFDVFIRDVGFKINEQNWFGDYVFLFDTFKASFLDGNLGGYEFEAPKETDSSTIAETFIPAYLDDGSENPAFFKKGFESKARAAVLKGAYWRMELKRTSTNIESVYMPNNSINAGEGDGIVFLGISMPDVYQRVAERRLEREAIRYLEANNEANIEYSFEFDKVRMTETPLFGIQMREGAVMRIVDDDLDIKTKGNEKILFDCITPEEYNTSMIYQDVSVKVEDVYTWRSEFEVYKYCEAPSYSTIPARSSSADDYFDVVLTILEKDEGKELYFNKSGNDMVCTFYTAKYDKPNYKPDPDRVNKAIITVISFEPYVENGYVFKNKYTLHCYKKNWSRSTLRGWIEYCVKTQKETPISTPKIYAKGKELFASAQVLTSFISGKTYELILDSAKSSMTKRDASNNPIFSLVDYSGQNNNWFTPDNYEITNVTYDPSLGIKSISELRKWERYKIKFTLPESFNDNYDYYPAISVKSDGVTDSYSLRLLSIKQYDNEELHDVNYVDLVIDSVSIDFHDNTREKDVMLQNGLEPARIADSNSTGMYREISATVKQGAKSQGWGTVSNKIDRIDTQSNSNAQAYQTITNIARENYALLLSLKDSIFDPDGTCNGTLVETMMLQVGADSMNYRLKYTGISADGKTTNNFAVIRGVGRQPDMLIFKSTDELNHYVYTKSQANGKWYITKPNDQKSDRLCTFILSKDASGEWPVYYISIKCNINDSRDAEWVCSTDQKAVNAEDGYYYFNWGILTPDEEGHYTPQETRGCAYMYGDNIICGKISSIANNSYFDLTHGNFVLGETQNGSMLSYKDGVLTISNAFTSTSIDGGAILTDLLLLKNQNGEVVAGMSGKTGEPGNGVTMWSGGTYEDALLQAQGLVSQLTSLLPVLITKEGIGSQIGCFKVESSTEVSVSKYDTSGNVISKILIDAGHDNEGPNICFYNMVNGSLQKTMYLTSDFINPRTDIYRFGGVEYNESDRPNIRNSDGTIKSLVNLYNISTGTNSTILLKDNKLYIEFLIYPQLSRFDTITMTFDLYIGNTKLCTSSTIITEEDEESRHVVYEGKGYHEICTFDFNHINVDATYVVFSMRNIVCQGVSEGTTYPIGMKIVKFGFGEGTNNEDFEFADVDIVGQKPTLMTIGSNGISMNRAEGGFIEMLNDQNMIYYRMFGLPWKRHLDETSKSNYGRVFEDTISFSKFKSKLYDFLLGDYYACVKNAGISNASKEVVDCLPDNIENLGIL